MANEVVIPKTFVNNDPEHGVTGDIADATDFNANNVKLNDKIYLSTTAPASPFVSQIWVKTDEDNTSPLKVRMWLGDGWYAIQIALIG